jgi:hypothetical protein
MALPLYVYYLLSVQGPLFERLEGDAGFDAGQRRHRL